MPNLRHWPRHTRDGARVLVGTEETSQEFRGVLDMSRQESQV